MSQLNGRGPEFGSYEDAPPLKIGTVLDDKFQLTEFIGIGGMGSVYKAKHLELGNDVAIKILHPRFANDVQSVKRFQREARIISQLRHNNILSVLSFGSVTGLVYMAMEYIQGSSLRALVENNGPLSLQQAIPLLVQICDAMIHAHASDVLHRDLKPDNALVVTGPDALKTVKVVDFGLAKLSDGSEVQRLTKTGEVLGDPNYMSPEQCTGKPLDERSDIYSMGCLMYEVFTGAPPFVTESAVATMYKQLEATPAAFAQEHKLPMAIEAIVMHAMAKNKDDRYESFEVLKQELLNVATNPNVKLQAPARLMKRSALTKNAAVAVIITGLLIACAALLWTNFSEQQAAEREEVKERLTKLLNLVDPDIVSPISRVKEKDVVEAIELATKLKDENALATARYALACLHVAYGRYGEALNVVNQSLTNPTPSTRRRAQLTELTGKIHYFAGNYKLADTILSRLYDDSQLCSELDGGRSSFAYMLGKAKLEQGKIDEAQQIADSLQNVDKPLNGAINMEAMFAAELSCKKKKFVEADKIKEKVLSSKLTEMSRASALEHFCIWFAANGDQRRARLISDQVKRESNQNRSWYLQQIADELDLYCDYAEGRNDKVLIKGRAIIERQLSGKIAPRMLSSVCDVYASVLDAQGRKEEAQQVKNQVKQRVTDFAASMR